MGFTTLWKRIPVLWGRLRGTAFVAAVTPLGWATLLVGGATTMIGWSYGWLEFRGLGFLALTLLVLAVLLTLRRPNHDGHQRRQCAAVSH